MTRSTSHYFLQVLLATGLACLTLAPANAQTASLQPFFPAEVGDSWTFESQLDANTGEVTVVLITAREPAHSGNPALRREVSTGDFRLQRPETDGLWIESTHSLGDEATLFREPTLVVPFQLGVGESHNVEVPFLQVTAGKETGAGTQTYSLTRGPNQSVTTFAGNFESCLVLTLQAERKLDGGNTSGYRVKEWRAAKVGLVKVTGEIYVLDAAGNRSSSRSIDLLLSGATVGNRVIEDRSTPSI